MLEPVSPLSFTRHQLIFIVGKIHIFFDSDVLVWMNAKDHLQELLQIVDIDEQIYYFLDLLYFDSQVTHCFAGIDLPIGFSDDTDEHVELNTDYK